MLLCHTFPDHGHRFAAEKGKVGSVCFRGRHDSVDADLQGQGAEPQYDRGTDRCIYHIYTQEEEVQPCGLDNPGSVGDISLDHRELRRYAEDSGCLHSAALHLRAGQPDGQGCEILSGCALRIGDCRCIYPRKGRPDAVDAGEESSGGRSQDCG